MERSLQTETFELRGAEGCNRPAELRDGTLGDDASLVEPWLQVGGCIALHHFELEAEQNQALRGVVVKLAANAAALFFFGVAGSGFEAPQLLLEAGALDGFVAAF